MIIVEPVRARKAIQFTVIKALSPKNVLISRNRSSMTEKTSYQARVHDIISAGQRRI
ncbi:hypothetical protein [Nonomuraea sp. NPDC005501]|uniref:hypothetical protein n=1 Tax=Nonomuraea sp. NPDC005501 TaxID=3156884 RepID=UPI0033A88E9C